MRAFSALQQQEHESLGAYPAVAPETSVSASRITGLKDSKARKIFESFLPRSILRELTGQPRATPYQTTFETAVLFLDVSGSVSYTHLTLPTILLV